MKIRQKLGYSLVNAALASTLLFGASAVEACGPDAYIGMVCMTAGSFCPHGYLEAVGQILNITSNVALFSVIGMTYGGNGTTTFALPDLRGRTPVGIGQGTGLSSVSQGDTRGAESVTLTVANLPAHSHPLMVSQAQGTNQPTTDTWLADVKVQSKTPFTATHFQPSASAGTTTAINAGSIGNVGSSQAVSTLPPQLGLRYCVAVTGTYPPYP